MATSLRGLGAQGVWRGGGNGWRDGTLRLMEACEWAVWCGRTIVEHGEERAPGAVESGDIEQQQRGPAAAPARYPATAAPPVEHPRQRGGIRVEGRARKHDCPFAPHHQKGKQEAADCACAQTKGGDEPPPSPRQRLRRVHRRTRPRQAGAVRRGGHVTQEFLLTNPLPDIVLVHAARRRLLGERRLEPHVQ
eukprot:scaffold25427_cov112-Isochrysis_galbana.AAC.3